MSARPLVDPRKSTGARHPFFWIALAMGAWLVALYAWGALVIFRHGAFTKDFGWSQFREGRSWYVSDVDPRGPSAGRLQSGDRIVAFGGDTRYGFSAWVHRNATRPGARYTLTVVRGPATHTFELSAPIRRDPGQLVRLLPLFVVGLAFGFVTVLLGASKPDVPVVRLAGAAAFTMSLELLWDSLEPLAGFLDGSDIVLFWLVNAPVPFSVALGYHFYYRFPPSVPRGRFWSFFQALLYVWAALECAFFNLRSLFILQGHETALQVFHDYSRLWILAAAAWAPIFPVALLAMLAVVTRNYRLTREPDQRRRIRWLVYGSIGGFLPTAIVTLAALILISSGREGLAAGEGFLLLYSAAAVVLVLIPLTTAYAVLRHRLFDIRVVVRRGLQYLLARNVLRIVLSLPVSALVFGLVANPDQTVSQLLFDHPLYLFWAAAAAASLRFRKELTGWLDRKFFREAYDRERLLLLLVDEIKDQDSISDVSRLVSEHLDAALHPTSTYAFYRDAAGADLSLDRLSGGDTAALKISQQSALLRLMEGQPRPKEVSFSEIDLPAEEKAWLQELGIVLVVPMVSGDQRLVGLLLLGEKKSEEPYTPSDRRLLKTVAGQMAFAHENAALRARVRSEEKVKREVLSRLEDQGFNLVRECPACGSCYDSGVALCAADGSPLALSVPVERTVEGKYRLDRLLGKGGMGAVYEATDLRLDRKVAVKIMTGGGFSDPHALRRFEREARASARLAHPNIITVYDFGPIGSEGAYLVMELLRGSTLRSEIKRAGALAPSLAVDWLNQVFEAMKAAHRAGIVHRDLKPENVLISKDEKGGDLVKVLDFGLAKVRLPEAVDATSLTVPGTVLGTLRYMSPEQLGGQPLDERTDIFSLGVIVAEGLTGRHPFGEDSTTKLVAAILARPFHLDGDSEEVRRLDDVLQKCLAKDRTARFSSVDEMQAQIIPAIRLCPPFPSGKDRHSDLDTTQL